MTHRIVEARRRLNPKDGYRAYLDKSSSWSRDLGFDPLAGMQDLGLILGRWSPSSKLDYSWPLVFDCDLLVSRFAM